MLGKLDSDMQKNEPGPLSYTIHKNKLKVDERPQCKTGSHQNHQGESRQNLFDLGHSNFLLNSSPEARETKAKMNYRDLIKIKSFCTAKETISKTKRQPTEWEKIFANNISDKGLVTKIYKEFIKLNIQKPNNPVKKWAEDMNRQTLFQRRHPDGKQTHEKILNITHHQENTNQNHNEIPPYSC